MPDKNREEQNREKKQEQPQQENRGQDREEEDVQTGKKLMTGERHWFFQYGVVVATFGDSRESPGDRRALL